MSMTGLNVNVRRIVPALTFYFVIELALANCVTATAWSSTQFYALAGPSIYKSSLVQQNESAYSSAWGVALSMASDLHVVQMGFEQESVLIQFQLNRSSLSLIEQDIMLVYRWYGLYFGPLFSWSNWHAKAPPDADRDGHLDRDSGVNEYLKMSVTSYGGNVGVLLTPAPNVDLVFDARASVGRRVDQSLPAAPEPAGISGTEPALGRRVTMGPRQSFTALIVTDLYEKYVSGLVGYRYRKYSMMIEDEEYKEIYSTTYIGVRLSIVFE